MQSFKELGIGNDDIGEEGANALKNSAYLRCKEIQFGGNDAYFECPALIAEGG